MFRDKSVKGSASSIVKSSGTGFLLIALDRSVNTAVSSAIWWLPRNYRVEIIYETSCDSSERVRILRVLVIGLGLSLPILLRCQGGQPAGAGLRQQSTGLN